MEANEIRVHAERLSEKPAKLIREVLIKANIGIIEAALQESRDQAEEIARLRAEVAALREDAERLDWIAGEYIKIDPFEMPTGQGDADVGWILSQYRMGRPSEVVLVEHYRDDLRGAIDAARKGGA